MNSMEVDSDNTISLRGSISHVLELLKYAINGILLHRGVYPDEEFYVEKRFGLDLPLILPSSTEDYIELTLIRLRDWLLKEVVKQVVVVVMDADDGHTIERWIFEPHVSMNDPNIAKRLDAEMDRELSAVMKDIITPTFLPPLEKQTVFDILVYVKDGAEVPEGWDTTHSHVVEDGEHDTMKGLTAPHHKVGLSVAYRDED
ncbi:DNA-binding protein, partial [Clavulina sp. PMI_390]